MKKSRVWAKWSGVEKCSAELLVPMSAILRWKRHAGDEADAELGRFVGHGTGGVLKRSGGADGASFKV